MSRVDLNFTLTYCARWDLRAAVREVIQNARDVEIEGGSFRVDHDAKTSTLTVTSEGQHLTSRALVFGATDKARDDRTIGQFGDGLKVALGVFLRHHVVVKINTGREIWTPCVVDRDGVKCVGMNTRALPAASHRERVTFSVGGITAEDWSEWQKMFLFLTPAAQVVSTRAGTLIRDADRRGHIYCKGIFVERREDLRYGYDLPHLELNRDREVADSRAVGQQCREVWAEASASAKDPWMQQALYAALSDPQGQDAVVSQYGGSLFTRAAQEAVAGQFVADYGADAVPVANSAEAQEAAACGKVGIVTAPSLRNVLTAAGVVGIAAVKASRRLDVTYTYTEDELTPREVDALQGAVVLFRQPVRDRDEIMPIVTVVDFLSETCLGSYSADTDTVSVARRALSEPNVLYWVLAHEIAHRHGDDGDSAHRQAIEDLMGRAIAGLMSPRE